MNVQYWHGFSDPKFGYGSMSTGLMSAVPSSVVFDRKASVSLLMGVPYSIKGWFEGQHRAIFTMWETDEMPASFRRWLPQFDQVIVPCQHNLDLFSKYHQNVNFVPLGVDTKFWTPNYKGPTDTQDGVYRFHGGGSLWRRKGLDVLVSVFKSLKLKDAELHIKAAPHAKDVPTERLGDNIFLHRNWMSLEAQRDWFCRADCYVAVARGEGFGLMPLQAIALGVPTIVSDSTGQSQFKHLATGVVPCRKTAAETIGRWDEPDPKVLADLMMDHYRDGAAKHAEAGKLAKGADAFTWRKSAQKLLSVLPTGTMLDTDVWQQPSVVVPIRVRRNVNADIGNRHYKLVPGVEYEVPENVHQVLFDSGALEVS